MHKRWYDIDPTVSLSVSLMRNANEETQLKCADLIIEYASQKNITLKSNTLNNAFNYILRRWYDQNKKVAEAFEYFQLSPMDIQKEIALEVISFLQLC